MSSYRNENELLQALSSLPREVAPENDVWPQIAGKVEGLAIEGASSPKKKQWWSAAIAASVLAVLIGGFVLKQPPAIDGLSPVLSSQPAEVRRDELQGDAYRGVPVLPGSITLEEQEYQAAFREYLSILPDPQSPFWPGKETFESGWFALQQVETELATALRQEPESQVLNSRMAALRARQLDLLQQIAAMELLSRRTTT